MSTPRSADNTRASARHARTACSVTKHAVESANLPCRVVPAHAATRNLWTGPMRLRKRRNARSNKQSSTFKGRSREAHADGTGASGRVALPSAPFCQRRWARRASGPKQESVGMPLRPKLLRTCARQVVGGQSALTRRPGRLDVTKAWHETQAHNRQCMGSRNRTST